MRHRIGSAAAVLACVWVAAAPRVFAYSGIEHRQVSQDALRIAFDAMDAPRCPSGADSKSCCGQPLTLTEEDQANLRALFDQTGSNISYADIVAFVDHVLDPIKLIERDQTISGLPTKPEDLNGRYLSELRSRLSLQAWAARNNDSHFQSQAMMSWWFWHRDAVLTAAYGNAVKGQPTGSERLFAGLFMNAISNHYLEDSFAPGHVITPREGMHDAAAISMHDYYNRVGAEFSIEPTRWQELAALIDPSRHAALFLRDWEAPWEREGLLREIEIEVLLRKIKDYGFGPGTLRFRGDDYLLPSKWKLAKFPDLQGQALRQRIFMTLVVARSILDVLESRACGEPVNSFESYKWWPLRQSHESGMRYTLARGGYPYGEYVEAPAPRIHYGVLSSVEISSQSTVLNGVEDTRGVITGVVIPTFFSWLPPPGEKVGDTYVPSQRVPAVALGLSYRMDDELPGFGSFVRLSLLSPRLDLHGGLALGVERYTWARHESYRFHPEARVGVGASLFVLFGAVGFDHALDANGNLKGSLTVRSGIQIGIPWSKIPRHSRKPDQEGLR